MSERVGAQRVLASHPRELIGGEGSRGDEVDKKKIIGGTPMGRLFSSMEKVLARVGDWFKEPD